MSPIKDMRSVDLAEGYYTLCTSSYVGIYVGEFAQCDSNNCQPPRFLNRR